MPPGEYHVRVSVFSAQANARLPLLDAASGFAGFYADVPGLRINANTEIDPSEMPIQTQLERRATLYVTLLGYDLPERSTRQGERIDLALYWLSEGHQPADADVIITLGDVVLYEGAPVHGTYPLTRWRPNELIGDRHALRVPADLPAEEYPLSVRLGDGEPVPLGMLTVEAADRRFESPPMTALDAPMIFGDRIALLGYDVADSRAPGQPFDLTLVWRAEREIETSYTVFVHLIDAAGNNVVQDDRSPYVDGQPYPTDLWVSGEVVADMHTLTLPTTAGEYRIRVGLYLADNGQRLSAPGVPDNALILPLTLAVP
jgi:hypothetical protein